MPRSFIKSTEEFYLISKLRKHQQQPLHSHLSRKTFLAKSSFQVFEPKLSGTKSFATSPSSFFSSEISPNKPKRPQRLKGGETVENFGSFRHSGLCSPMTEPQLRSRVWFEPWEISMELLSEPRLLDDWTRFDARPFHAGCTSSHWNSEVKQHRAKGN